MAVEDDLNQQPPIEIPPVSPLFAMATSGPRLSRGQLIGIGAFAGLVITCILFTLLCSATFFLPKETFFSLTASPKALNPLLSTDQKTTLPLVWQQSLATDSRWPVFFGLTGNRANQQAFVIGPRWAVPPAPETQAHQTRALIRQSGITEEATDGSASTFVYRETFFDRAFGPGILQGWLNPAPLFPRTSSTNQLVFHLEETGTLFVKDTAESLRPTTQLSEDINSNARPLATDLSLHIAALSNYSFVEELIAELPLAPIGTTLTSLKQSPSSLNIGFVSSTIDSLRLTFQGPLQPNEEMALVSLLEGSSKKRSLTLPDGTLTSEFIAHPERTITNSLQATPTLIDWQSIPGTPLLDATPCTDGVWIARVSPTFLQRLIPIETRLSGWIPSKAVQVWRKQNTLIICQET